jgi:hypothetical protein
MMSQSRAPLERPIADAQHDVALSSPMVLVQGFAPA